MSILLDFISAGSMKQIPNKKASTWFENEMEFNDLWVSKDDDEKTDIIAKCINEIATCCINVRNDNDLILYLVLFLINQTDRYDGIIDAEEQGVDSDDEEDETKQEVVVPTIHDDTELLKLREENAKLKEEIAKLKQTKTVVEPIEVKTEEKTTSVRGRGRPPKHASTEFKCILCDMCMSSSGSLHNHYKSKPHTEKVLSVLDEAKQYTNRPHTKIIVKVRSHIDDPEFTTENPDKAYLENIKDYVKDGYNPITDVLFVEGSRHPELKHLSWKKLC